MFLNHLPCILEEGFSPPFSAVRFLTQRINTWACKLVLPLWNAVWRFSEVRHNFTLWSDNPTTEYMSKGNEISTQKRYMQLPVYCSTPHQNPDMESTECSSPCEWVSNKWYIYTVGCNSAVKKNEILSCGETWMHLEDIAPSEIARHRKQTLWAQLTRGSWKRLGMAWGVEVWESSKDPC